MKSAKKIVSAFLTYSLLFSLSLQASAAQHWSDKVTVHAAGGSVTVDGVVGKDEWEDATAVNIKLNNDPIIDAGMGVYQGSWESTREDSDFSTTYKFKWDKDYFYVLEVRTDNFVCLDGNANKPYETDGTLIFMQVADNDSKINPDGYLNHIFYSVGKDGVIGGDLKSRTGSEAASSTQVIDVPGGKIASKLTDTGYLIELAFPWSMFIDQLDNYSGPKAGDELGFSIVEHDRDASGTGFEKQFCWAMFHDLFPSNGYDYGGWGTLVLDTEIKKVEETVSVSASTSDASLILFALAAISAGAVLKFRKK